MFCVRISNQETLNISRTIDTEIKSESTLYCKKIIVRICMYVYVYNVCLQLNSISILRIHRKSMLKGTGS